MRHLVLHNTYKSLGAHFVEFGEWEVPVYFKGIVEEHKAVRSGAGFFDVSHMGEVHVHGPGSLELLQLLVCNDVSKLRDGQVLYSPMMLPSGGIVDDILIYRLQPEHYFLIVNAANVEKDFDWIVKHNRFNAKVENISNRKGIFAIQGPRSFGVIESLFGSDIIKLEYYHFSKSSFAGKEVVVSRTGYTGEAGFEIFFDINQSEKLYEAIFEKGSSLGLQHIGFGARDTLRLEACFPLYGHELTDKTTPLEAGLGWTVCLGKKDFLGIDVLRKQKEKGVSKTLIGFEMVERGIPRSGCTILKDSKNIGTVTSGGFAPSLGKNIGLAYVSTDAAVLGSPIAVKIRNQAIGAQIVKTPFYKKRH